VAHSISNHTLSKVHAWAIGNMIRLTNPDPHPSHIARNNSSGVVGTVAFEWVGGSGCTLWLARFGNCGLGTMLQ